MAIMDSFKNLVHEELDCLQVQFSVLVAHVLLQVIVSILEHQNQPLVVMDDIIKSKSKPTKKRPNAETKLLKYRKWNFEDSKPT
jgi:hypothetical protein